jgi:hypothetical protein
MIDYQKHVGTSCEPESLAELFEFLKDNVLVNSLGSPTGWIWRGQSKRWPLHSSAYRRFKKGHLPLGKQGVVMHVNEHVMQAYERRLLADARQAGLNHVEGRVLNAPELIVRLQHHGAATRLLDFTRNVLTALWFASSENLEDEGVVVGVHPALGEFDPTRVEWRPERWWNFTSELDQRDDGPRVIRPSKVSPRIAAQQGVLAISKIVDEETGSFELHPKMSIAISVSPGLKQRLDGVWERFFGYSISQMFPDVDGFGMKHHFTEEPPPLVYPESK